MALSLAIGLLIDDAIVVRENIVRHLEKGQDHFEAAREGTAEIGLAVLATSMSIIAVFVPVAFMKGVVGRFFYQFGLTVAFAVAVSLFVSFTLDPMLSSRWHDPDIERKGRRSWWHLPLDAFNDWFERMAEGYKRVIAWSLDHRMVVVGAAFAAFVGGLAVFGLLQTEFMTQVDQGEFALKFKSAPGSSIDETRGRLEEVLRGLSDFKEVEYTYAAIASGDAETVRDALVFVKLVPKHERQRTLKMFIRDARQRLQTVPGVLLNFLEDPSSFQKPLVIAVQGDDIATLKTYAARLKQELYKVPGIVDIEATMEQDLPEYRLVVSRERAAASGLGSGAVANTVGLLVGGQAVSTYEDEEGEAVNVRVRLPQSLRGDVNQINDLKVTVPGPMGVSLVPLADLVTFSRATSPAEIVRRDLTRQVTVDANLDGLPLGTANNLAMAAGQALDMAPGYGLVAGGDAEMMIESFGYMAEALLLAIIFVYLILAAQFESFIDPLSIMLSLPLSIVGMAGTLLLTGDTINIMSLIGLIMLMGLVTKNAILLVDYTKVLRGQGMDRRTALITAGRTRLRPIMMTTTAMVFGMLPLFLAIGEGAEMRAPMARAVVGGLITSTLLTLIVVPVVYTILDDITAWMFRKGVHQAKAAAIGLAVLALVGGAAGTASAQTAATPASPGRPGTKLSLEVAIGQAAKTAAQPPASPGTQAAPASPAAPKVLTLDEALALAASKNRDIQKAIEYQKWVQGQYLEQRSYAMPQATFGASLIRSSDRTQQDLFKMFGGGAPGGDEGGVDIGEIFSGSRDIATGQFKVTQVLFTWGQVGAAIRAAKLGFGMADQQLRKFRQDVARDVTVGYYDVLIARELVKISEQDLDQKQRHLDEATKRQSAGTATDYDVLAAQVAVENARPNVIRSENLVRTARLRLAYLLAETGEIDATGALATPLEAVPTYGELLPKALANRPDLGEIESTRGIYGELVTIAKAGNKPRVDFAAGWGLGWVGLSSVSSSGSLWNAGVYASVPLFDGFRTKGRVAQAQSELARISLDELKLRDGVALQVQAAIDAMREASDVVKALSGTVQQAEKLLMLAEKGFELGVKTRLEVQDAEFNASNARLSLARAQRDYRVSRVNLEWVSGTLDGGKK
jgi:HAE1 family hydrophobic/amphiphilic exporter-1